MFSKGELCWPESLGQAGLLYDTAASIKQLLSYPLNLPAEAIG